MTTVDTPHAGALLRAWRERRGLSQLSLAHTAGISSRHLSFVKTSRSRPSRATVLRLSDRLDIPLRERNTILVAAGHAPVYPEHRLGDLPMAAISDAASLAFLKACLTVATTDDQISSGSCSTQPEAG